MAEPRRYAQYCPLARALDVVGERWTLLIIRNLLVGPQRYSELQESLPGITTNLLAKRLKELTAHGLLETEETHGVTVYRLTERGRALETALLALSSWGEAEPFPPSGHRHLRWVMLGIRRRYRGGINARVRFVSTDPERDFTLQFDDDAVAFRDGIPKSVDLHVEGTEDALLAAIYGRRSLRELVRMGAIRLEGSRRLLPRILRSLRD